MSKQAVSSACECFLIGVLCELKDSLVQVSAPTAPGWALTPVEASPASAPPSVLEIFAGGGAWGIGAKRLGWSISAAYDIDPDCVAVYNRNVAACASLLNLAEVSNWPLVLRSRASLVLGSPPCPPWSRAGKGLGFRDERSHLMCAYLCLTWLLQASYFGLEQVASFATFQQGRDFRLWKALWAVAGYDLAFETVSAHVLLPIRRDRLLVLGRLRNGGNRQRQLLLTCGSLPSRQPCPFARGFVDPEVCPHYAIVEETALARYANSELMPVGLHSRFARHGHLLSTLLHSYGEAHNFGEQLHSNRGLHGQLINSAWYGQATVRFLTAEEVRRLQCFPFSYGLGPGLDPKLMWSIMGNALPLTFVGIVLGCLEADWRQLEAEPLVNSLLISFLAAVWAPAIHRTPRFHGLFPLPPSALSRTLGEDFIFPETMLLAPIIDRIVQFLPADEHKDSATAHTQLGLWNFFQELGPPRPRRGPVHLRGLTLGALRALSVGLGPRPC